MNPTPAQEPAKDPDGQGGRPALSVVIVNHDGWPDVARLVAALSGAPELADGRAELIVVDNASRGPVPAELLRPRPGLRLILRPDNGGFAAGVNAGWLAAKGRRLLLLNPDIVAGADLLAKVLDRRPRGAREGVVGFGLLNPDGTRQPSVGADPNLARSLLGQFIPRSRRKYQAGWRGAAGAVPWVTGACALVDSALLAELGGMDEEFFLYYEEVALCRLARQRGWAVAFDPGIEVVHLRPLQNRPVTPRLRVITRHSKLLYFRKFLPRWQFAALSWVVSVEALARGGGAWAMGRATEARAWRVIGRMARALGRGGGPLGRGVLALADSVEAPPLARGGPHLRRAGASRRDAPRGSKDRFL